MWRTYLPTLLKVMTYMCAYIGKHHDRIVEVIGTDNAPKLEALVTACHVLTEVILPLVGTGS